MEILWEDRHFIAVNKPTGIPIQPDKTQAPSVLDWVKERYAGQQHYFCDIIHRIDRPVTGVTLFGKSREAIRTMSQQFQEKQVQKTYLAVVSKVPEVAEGQLVHWIKKIEKINLAKVSDTEKPGSKRAEMHYRVLGEVGGFHLLQLNPLTGRHHQIRAQLGAIGSPICGDRKYGYPRYYEGNAICLHAFGLAFEHPFSKEKVQLNAPLPAFEPWQKLSTIVSA